MCTARVFRLDASDPACGSVSANDPTAVPVAKGRSLKQTMAATREMMDPKFSGFAIYEHCLPFNVSRAFDEASGIDDPVIWTDKRDQEMWAALQGGG